MTITLTEFLREQAKKEKETAAANKADIDEWRKSIEKLFGQIRGWLSTSDPDGIIEIKQKEHEIREEGLGRYTVPRLDFRAFGKWIGIIPKARNTIATAQPPQKSAPERAKGRVDITDEVQRYILYLFPKDGGDLWMIGDLQSDPKPLDQQTFEAALMSYLR